MIRTSAVALSPLTISTGPRMLDTSTRVPGASWYVWLNSSRSLKSRCAVSVVKAACGVPQANIIMLRSNAVTIMSFTSLIIPSFERLFAALHEIARLSTRNLIFAKDNRQIALRYSNRISGIRHDLQLRAAARVFDIANKHFDVTIDLTRTVNDNEIA